jgi:hypothetical protein
VTHLHFARDDIDTVVSEIQGFIKKQHPNLPNQRSGTLKDFRIEIQFQTMCDKAQ